MADRLSHSEELKQRSLSLKEQRGLLPEQTMVISIVRNHRRWISRDLDKLLTSVWDPSLGDDQLMALNDEINRKIKLKLAWDARLVQLGGVLEATTSSNDSSTSLGGYHYYGRAKKFDPNASDTETGVIPERTSSTRPLEKRSGFLYNQVNAEYYGFHRKHVDIIVDHMTDVKIPSDADIQQAILNAKRQELLQKLSL